MIKSDVLIETNKIELYSLEQHQYRFEIQTRLQDFESSLNLQQHFLGKKTQTCRFTHWAFP